MRTWLGSITCLRKPAKLPGPALPVSMAVVTPDRRQIFGVDAERRAAPIDVRVQIDQPRGHDRAGHVAHVGRCIGLQGRTDARDLAVRECYIGNRVELLRWI